MKKCTEKKEHTFLIKIREKLIHYFLFLFICIKQDELNVTNSTNCNILINIHREKLKVK